MTKKATPAAPSRSLPEPGDDHYRLSKDVRETIFSLPISFRTETHIFGIMATDLHTRNTVLGATIEEQVVRSLNLIRNTWDSEEKYALSTFIRQAQTFPDVLLRKTSTDEILLEIELKGWYLPAKEAKPSLRFQDTSAACARRDLIVVVPWVFGNAISGSPFLFEPFVGSAKDAADYRNDHWQWIREMKQDTRIEIPGGVGLYPSKADQILDKPRSDGGGNFGCLARTGMMDRSMQKINEVHLCGIKTVYSRQFLKAFQQSTTDAEARLAIDRLRQRVQRATDIPSRTLRRHSRSSLNSNVYRT
ncbi:MAG: hypothetical protein ACUVTW_15600 [Thermogutta sp.]